MISEYKQLFEDMLKEVLSIEGVDSDKAVSVASVLVQEYGKNKRTEMMRDFSSNGYGNSSGNQKATEKQISFLKQLGVNVTEGITKKEASDMIAQAKNSGNSNA